MLANRLIARRFLATALAASLALGLGLAAPTVAAADDVTRVMFVGDSITGAPGCWRAPVWVSLTDAGHAVDMVGINTVNECGDVTNASGLPWDPDNTGIGGITTTGMWIKLARDKVLEQTQPDVIVMLLGTNDLLGGSSAQDILAEYDQLVELYRDYAPGITVVVGTPPPLDEGACDCDAEQAALAEALPDWALGVSTPESPVTVADLSTGFDPATHTDDGIHPNDAGNAALAAAWTPVIDEAVDGAGAGPAGVTSTRQWVVLIAVAVVLTGIIVLTARRRPSQSAPPSENVTDL